MSKHQTIVVLDFGSQVTQLIARRIRELGVYAEILPYDVDFDELKAKDPVGIILSGGPASIYDEDAPQLDARVFDLGIPLLGICYGMYIVVAALGGSVERSDDREFGSAKLNVIDPSGPVESFSTDEDEVVWMSHSDSVVTIPDGFVTVARSANCEYAAIRHPEKNIWAVQFHPEVTHTVGGERVFESFTKACGCSGDWTMDSFVDEAIAKIREQVGDSGTVICGLSGGVDSSVAAALMERAIGDRLHCIFVDNGLLRKNERDAVSNAFEGRLHNPLIVAQAEDEFLGKLSGEKDPEKKRKAIGATFIDVFDRESKKLGGADFLVQGTLYPDVIESVSTRGPSATIKTHHNVGGLPEHMRMKVVEPLRELFKDEVRRLGLHLGLTEELIWRHPFPGPGLAVRIIGEVTKERCDRLREADAIILEEVRKAGLYRRLWQVFGVLLPIQTVGVMGDARTYENALAVRAVESVDAMTADWAQLPYEVLGSMSNRIINEVRGINRVCYDISSKPPATIEWE